MKKQEEIVKAEEFGLDVEKATLITNSFIPKIEETNGYQKVYSELINSEITPEIELKAKRLRLDLVKVRTGIASIHKVEKQFYLQAGKFVDALKNKLTLPVEQMEEKLEEIENYSANLEKKRLQELQEQRLKLVSPFLDNLEGLDLSTMTEDVFESFLTGAKAKFEAKKEAERLEAERIEAERLAEIERQKQIEAENLRLKKEAEEREAQLLKERQEAEAKQKEIQAKAEAELKAQREEKERLEAELKAKQEAEAKAEAERLAKIEKEKLEAEKLAKAPIKKQLNIWVDSFELNVAPIENDKTKEILEKFESFKNWAKKQVESI